MYVVIMLSRELERVKMLDSQISMPCHIIVLVILRLMQFLCYFECANPFVRVQEYGHTQTHNLDNSRSDSSIS